MKTLALLMVAYAAAMWAPVWLLWIPIALVLLFLIREFGPKDPPPVRHTVTQLRRRQLDQVCDRQRVRR